MGMCQNRGPDPRNGWQRVTSLTTAHSQVDEDLYDDLLGQKSTAEIWNVDYAEAG